LPFLFGPLPFLLGPLPFLLGPLPFLLGPLPFLPSLLIFPFQRCRNPMARRIEKAQPASFYPQINTLPQA